MKRFPVVLTVVSLIAFGVLVGLGSWQLQRLVWKQGVLARIEALRHAPPRPIDQVMAAAARGEDVDYARAVAHCAPPAAPSPTVYRYALREGQVGWRLLTACHLAVGDAGAPYDGVILDRGLVARFTGAMAPSAARFPEPGAVIGVMRALGAKPWLSVDPPPTPARVPALRLVDRDAVRLIAAQSGLRRPAPYVLATESEAPSPPGLRPAALPEDVPNNHLVYALTWFALAGILSWFYGALLLRRLSDR